MTETRPELKPRREQRHAPRKRTGLWIALAILGVIVFAAAWVGIRGLLAKQALEAAVPEASALAGHIAAGDRDAASDAYDTLSDNASSAASLTSDPIWRAAEFLPYLGANLTAVREAADIVDDVTHDGIAPIITVTETVGVEQFKPLNGAIPLQPLVEAQPALASANTAMTDAAARARAIDTDRVLEVVASAVDRLETTVTDAAVIVDAVDRAAALLPPMLGAEGPRNYVLLFQNPAEPRATGGIPGALAQITVTDGAISLTQQASSADFPRTAASVLELPLETRGIYGDITGRFIQDVNLTPQFPLSGALAAEMWRQQFGTEVDGVLSVDPVTLGYLLKATGPITLETGDVLTSENAVQLLLSDVYARYPNPKQQDVFFASAAAAVFDTVAAGNLEPAALLDALLKAGEQGRVLVWSAHEDEQARIAETTLAGTLPVSDDATQRFGVYFNDATGSKMGSYLQASLGAAQATCRADGRPTYAVEVTLTNTAPADAATFLPRYVTGGGAFGVTPGNFKLITYVYGPEDALGVGLFDEDNAPISHQSAVDDGHPVSAHTVELAPGQTIKFTSRFLGKAPFRGDLEIRSTPGVNAIETPGVAITCETP